MAKETLTRKEELKPVIPLKAGQQLPLSRPLVMGILNVTPDSFSDGGKFQTFESAKDRALQIRDEGADILDIGGESTRPGSSPVTPTEEIRRVIPVIEAVRPELRIPISVDTTSAATARAALDAGADIVNDISALRFDPEMAQVVAEHKVPVVLMHMLGSPKDMQVSPNYVDCIKEIMDFFRERIDFAVNQGIDRSKIIIDPGIGFGKRLSDNIEILTNLSEFTKLGLPILIGTSRKSFIGMLSGLDNEASERIGGSIGSMVAAVLNGANIVRVHDVKESVEALKVVAAVRGNR
jgi:dihydropteroate synthase